MPYLKVTSAGSLELHFYWLTFTSSTRYSKFIIEWDTGIFVVMSDSLSRFYFLLEVYQ